MKSSPFSWLLILAALAFTLAVTLVTPAEKWSQRSQSDNFFGMLLGDGRKLFANQFFTMADVYFHSGYYPSIFDRKEEGTKAIVSATQAQAHEGCDHDGGKCEHERHDEEECEKHGSFFGQPGNWLDAFGRNFKITQHTHLERQDEREILPWLRLAADLDPQKIETYTVGAYFLREKLDRPDQAEAFLREGFRHNPDSPEILFELGRVYHEGLHDNDRARNVWVLGVNKFLGLKPEVQKENKLIFEQLVVHLARLEDEAGNYAQAINWFRAAQTVSPAPEAIQERIDAVQKKISAKQP
jgi:tetratricopeptide (TPR) repeat protein